MSEAASIQWLAIPPAVPDEAAGQAGPPGRPPPSARHA